MSATGSEVDDIPQDTSEYTETDYFDEGEGGYYEYGEEEFVERPLLLRSEDFISGPYLSEESTLPDDILEFHFSHGYNCKKYFNLAVPDQKTLLFISGNLLNFFDVDTKSLWFRRSAFGGGLGHVVKNHLPQYPHIAVAENGEDPPIIIYEWPSLEIVRLLKGGSSRCFTHLNYSPNGLLLASQGGEPDHLITIWDWPKSHILLRTKSYVNDVHRVKFSPYVPGHLTSCGLSHIKFWKMASTFTGLKLQGELGRFGKTEFSDILGIYPMPDEKVISGCFWGNFLVWEAGLIKLEVFRKLRKRCHDGPIVQFDYRDGELWTVAMDGRVRVWHYDTIDQADPPDDDRVVQTEPVYDFYTPGVEFMCIEKRSDDPLDTFYYAQDGQGGLWIIDLTTELNVSPSVQLYKCHAGAVVDIAACPWGHYLASLGVDGRLHIYNIPDRELIFIHQYPAKGVCMAWLPLEIDSSGEVLILGFDDGNLRVIALKIDPSENTVELFLLQITKPHNRPLTCMSINGPGTILVTAGEDKTIFVFQIQPNENYYVFLQPIGLVPTTDIVTCITWHRSDSTIVILGCLHGYIDQVTIPAEPQPYTTVTYILHVTPIHQRFVTYKAQIRRDIKLKEIAARKEAKRERKRVEMEKFKKENPGLEVDEEIFLADSESEEELEPLHIPEIPNKVIWIQHTVEDTLWLSMGGYDAGYIYEYTMEQKSEIPYRFLMVHDADDTEIGSFVYNYNKKYLIFAMENGAIRVNKVKANFTDLKDYWQLSMHDNYNGYVPRMCFSYDEEYFFSCGHDGNIFSYTFNPEFDDYVKLTKKRREITAKIPHIYDDDSSYKTLSLEEAILKKEVDRKQKLADDHKDEYREKLSILKKKFQALLKRNRKLLPSQTIPRDLLELDPRITDNLRMKLDDDLALVERKLAFQVEKSEIGLKKLMAHFIDPLDTFPICVTAVRKNIRIKTLRQRKLNPEFFDMQKLVDEKIIEADLKGRPPERLSIFVEAPPAQERQEEALESFLIALSPSTIEYKLGPKVNRLLHKYRTRRTKHERRQHEWEKFNAMKPVEGVNHPDDEAALAIAIATIGDYKLKSAPDYKVPRHLRESTVKKYKQLLNMRKKQFNLRHNFNEKVHDIRDKKVKLGQYLLELLGELEHIHKEIPAKVHRSGPETVEMHEHDFAEKNLEIVLDIHDDKRDEEVIEWKLISEPTGDLLEKEALPCLEETNFLDHNEKITPWEHEMKKLRLKRKVFEQKETIKKMNKAIVDFDDIVQNAFNERLQVIVDASFLDMHMLTLHQELLILKDFEAVEDQLSDNVHSIMEELLDIQDLVIEMNYKIETRKKDIESAEEKGKSIQHEFLVAAQDSKFFDFLRRIFKKKYRPPRIRGPDDSDSSSESSSSSGSSDEDEDAGSIDSRDVGPIRLDESVCPKGCDQSVYDATFALRAQRHTVELEIKEHNRIIETIKKDIELTLKKCKTVEGNLKTSQDELETYQREKQRKLNEVMCTVVSQLHQFQHIIGCTGSSVNTIKDSLVFSKTTLANLYKRVGQLEAETSQQKDKHRLNIRHLARMKTDCKSMERRIQELDSIIRITMRQKFGRVVDLNEIEEALLKRLIIDLRLSLLDIKSMYEEEMTLWKLKIGRKQLNLMKAIRNNTAKLELLGLLNYEKATLLRRLQQQEEKQHHIEVVSEAAEVYKRDISKLAHTLRNQNAELEALREEIKALKLKGLKPRPELERVYVEEAVEEEEFELMELDEDDECIQIHLSEIFTPQQLCQPTSATIAKDILQEMLEAIDVEKLSVEKLDLEQTVSDILHQKSVAEIIDELLAFLKNAPTDQEQGIIETTAEKLYVLTTPEISEIDIAKETLIEILNAAILTVEPYEAIADMINEIIAELPIDFILQKQSVDAIVSKINGCDIDIDREELTKAVLSTSSSSREEIETILDRILEGVFGSGISFLYQVKQ